MIDHQYTTEELLAAARDNAVSFALEALEYIKKQGKSADELTALAASRLAPTWKRLANEGASAFLKNLALNVVSLGGDVQSINGDEKQAEAVFTDWIQPEEAKTFGLTEDEADKWWDVFQSVAASANLQYSWQRTGDKISVKLSR